jgi:nucleoside-diphosphate-sugar epimerase
MQTAAMPKALIIGGRGQCGRAIGHRLAAAGWTVTSSTAGPIPDEADTPGISWTAFGRDEADDLRSVVTTDTDLVVDVTAFTPGHAEQLIALGDRIGSAIVISTLSVYTDSQGRSLDQAEDESAFPAWPVPIPESWPILTAGDDTYSSRKAAMERVLRNQAPWPVTIVRPGAIHGPHGRHLREWYFIQRVLDRRHSVILPFGGDCVFQPTATVNLAELVALAAARPSDLTLNCGDLNPPSVAQINATIDDLMNWTTERVLIPGPEPAPTVGNHPWGVPRSVVADMRLAEAELGYREAATYADALAATLAWAVNACAGRDWREVFPTLAAYPTDLFDYQAEDTYLGARREALPG